MFMSWMPKFVALAAIVGSGLVSGFWSNRFTSPGDTSDFAERAYAIPMTIGEWEGRDLPVSAVEKQISQAYAILRREYTHRGTGMTATLMVVSGPPGPISVHTPESCFPNAGWTEIGTASRVSPKSDSKSQFFLRFFRKSAVSPGKIGAYYAWSDGEPWEAPNNPRIRYIRTSMLFKMYVVSDHLVDKSRSSQDSAMEFLNDSLPNLSKSLFSQEKIR